MKYMTYRSVERAAKNVLDRTKNLFSAARYEEIINTGYKFATDYFDFTDRKINTLAEDLIAGALSERGWYQELIHGRVPSEVFASNYPAFQKKLIELTERCMNFDPFGLSGSNLHTSLAVEYVQLIRNQIMMRNWAKYRKAYVFDKDLAKDLILMSDKVEVPLELPDHLPFPYLYMELPSDIPELDSYSGVYISIQRESGIKRIASENVKVLDSLVKEQEKRFKLEKKLLEEGFSEVRKTKSGNWVNVNKELSDTESTYNWLLEQRTYNVEDANQVMENEYISLHLLFVGKQMDEMGFNETFTYIMALTSNEDGICCVDRDYIDKKVHRDEFDDPDKMSVIIIYLLNALMYLGAANADIESKKVCGIKKLKPRDPKKGKKQKIEWEDTDIELNSCGFMYGASVRAFREQQGHSGGEYEKGTGNRRPMRPHPVRGHYQRYHKGKGRTNIEWILKAPHYNFGSLKANQAPITNVSVIEGEK